TWINYSAFKGCSSLTNINVLENNANYKSIDGNLYSKDGKTLIKYAIGKTATEFSIPNSVTSIGNYAFYNCSSLTSVTIPDSVTSIGSYAFECCSSLTSVTIPNSVTSIGVGAFSGCNSLGVEKNNGLLYVDKWLIGVNSISIDSATIKDKTVGIGDGAFWHCSALTSVIIPDSVTSIGAGAFSGCTSLININIPDSVVNISLSTIAGCSNLQYNEYDNAYYLGNDTNPYVILIGAKSADIIIINENTKTIASDAFDGCKSLKSITIPDSVTNIGYGLFGDVFHGCDSLKTVYMDSATLINTSFSDELPNFATDVYVRTDLTPTVSVYTNIYEKQDGTVIHDGKEYYHYKIKE
ncbi:MAG: leucine-rich repeat domain-containing protein, partial [Clostridia bacterium]|nr:leucine-rich repeat domain-containing protein [Clostridia bacterium]